MQVLEYGCGSEGVRDLFPKAVRSKIRNEQRGEL